ncbi:hypothetical protein QBC37DRAFT_117193 [Rhypophila decipiens]|uniref:Uncharacterized protein n=1 Tax=Rhypophila decipiens TaxID=261697 RepID=A0AAN6YDB4_9PEZI|nr:hypothetical protein QBC37DRAFT_117193 [Rhypophila decipiens]
MKMLVHLLPLWTLVCPALAHPQHHDGNDYYDNDDERPCRPPTRTTTKAPTTTTSLAASCTFTGTQTFYSSGGCNGLACETAGFCIIDAAATKSCGCDSLVIVTKTTTICPTKTPCYQCTTGWGTFIETQSCTSTTISPHPIYT